MSALARLARELPLLVLALLAGAGALCLRAGGSAGTGRRVEAYRQEIKDEQMFKEIAERQARFDESEAGQRSNASVWNEDRAAKNRNFLSDTNYKIKKLEEKIRDVERVRAVEARRAGHALLFAALLAAGQGLLLLRRG